MNKIYPDISHHHTVGDWEKFADAVGFAISKGTQGLKFVDPYMRTFVKECESRGIPYWLYTYLNKGSEMEQAKYLTSVCKPYVGKYFCGYILDVEEGNSAAQVQTALRWLAAQGGKCMIYTGWSDYGMYKNVLKNRPSNVAWWEARYGIDNGSYNERYSCHDGCDLHQYTSNGSCPGVPDKIDLNRLTGNKPLEWFTNPGSKGSLAAPATTKYTGAFPSLPARGYYAVGDGYMTNPDNVEDIKNLQELVNWINDGHIVVDGKYGPNTAAAVKLAQTTLKVSVDGLFGKKTLSAAKDYRK